MTCVCHAAVHAAAAKMTHVPVVDVLAGAESLLLFVSLLLCIKLRMFFCWQLCSEGWFVKQVLTVPEYPL